MPKNIFMIADHVRARRPAYPSRPGRTRSIFNGLDYTDMYNNQGIILDGSIGVDYIEVMPEKIKPTIPETSLTEASATPAQPQVTDQPMPDIPSDKDLTASDLQKAAGLSYRQLNSWDEKGVLPESREADEAWRKFTPNDAFIVLIYKELRDQFGVPLETLKRFQNDLLKNDVNYLEQTVHLIGQAGLTVCLLTDLKKNLIIDNDLEISTLFREGLLRNPSAEDYIILRLNPLVNRLFDIIGLPPLPAGAAVYDAILTALNKGAVQSSPEYHLLELVRSKDFRQITVHLKDGQIIQTDTFEELGKKVGSEKELLKIIGEKQYQSIAIDLTGGEIIRISRKSPVKYNKETGKS